MSPRILLVDDEANIRKMVGALLQSEGFETLEAPNGAAALAAVQRDAPDAVLLDLMMPGGPDGLATLEQCCHHLCNRSNGAIPWFASELFRALDPAPLAHHAILDHQIVRKRQNE